MKAISIDKCEVNPKTGYYFYSPKQAKYYLTDKSELNNIKTFCKLDDTGDIKEYTLVKDTPNTGKSDGYNDFVSLGHGKFDHLEKTDSK